MARYFDSLGADPSPSDSRSPRRLGLIGAITAIGVRILHTMRVPIRCDLGVVIIIAGAGQRLRAAATAAGGCAPRRKGGSLPGGGRKGAGVGRSGRAGADDAAPRDVAEALNFGTTRLTNGIQLHVVGPLGIHGSTHDVNQLLLELLAGRVLKPATVQAMTSPKSRAPTFDNGEQYGYGWAVPPADKPAATFAHLGEKDGFRSVAFVDMASGVQYVIHCQWRRPCGKGQGQDPLPHSNLSAMASEIMNKPALKAGQGLLRDGRQSHGEH